MRLPMFPLNSGIVPHAILPLRVFEPRYRAMIDDIGPAGRLGVVMIERGSEVGGEDVRFDIGTICDIVAHSPLAGGDVRIVIQGQSRLAVERWLPDDPYPRADVQELADGELRDDAGRARLVDRYRAARLLAARAGIIHEPGTLDLSNDVVAATYQAMALVPLGSLDRQQLLEVEDPADRLAATLATIDDWVSLVELELGAR